MNELLQAPSASGRGLSNTTRYAIYGALFGLAFPVVAIGISLAVNRLPLSMASIMALQINEPLLWIIDTAPFFLGVFAALAGIRQDAMEQLNLRLSDQARDLAASQRTLEQRMTRRSDELEERNRQLRQTVQVTRRIARARESEDLGRVAVEALAENMPEFVVDLYLIDERRAEAVRSASSQAAPGEETEVIAVRIGDAGLVGQVASTGEMGRSVTGEHGSELALPLLSGGIPIGVLHVRPQRSGVAAPLDTELLQLISDQLASALETARSLRQASTALEQLRTLTGETTQTAWRMASPGEVLAFEYTPAGVKPSEQRLADPDPARLRVPLELRGQRIGTISLKRRGSAGWTDADRDLAEKTAAQVALALENVRLLEETRERAQQEQLLSELSARLNQSVNLDALLQTAVRELAALPEVAGASIYLRPEPAAGATQTGTGE